ncbi:glycosyltransferase, partial [bacterium]|nr:glycosyltransferase [bacterium]
TTAVGPAAARNQGAEAAQGEILGFLDSDVVVHPGWWQAAAPHFNHPKVAAVEGATLPPENAGRPTPFTHFVCNNRGASFQTCNLLCRRDVFWKINGFDERFCWQDRRGKLWHIREDTDLAFSILKLKSRIEFEPEAIAVHPLLPAGRGLHLQKAYYGSAEVLLRRRHPRFYRQYMGWIDGRAFPVFYGGIFLGLPLWLGGLVSGITTLSFIGAGAFLSGWAGSVYAVCRKRKVSLRELALLGPQFLIIPWMRLCWVLYGEWKYRKIKEVK